MLHKHNLENAKGLNGRHPLLMSIAYGTSGISKPNAAGLVSRVIATKSLIAVESVVTQLDL
jgi:hypothetical protein